MKIARIILLILSFQTTYSQNIKNDFFTLHNIIRGDSVYNTFDKQVVLLKSAGFDGVEINGEDSFDGMKAALDKYKFHSSYFYVKLQLDTPYIDSRLGDYIRQLKGTKTIIAPYIVSNKKFPRGTHGADTVVVRLLRELADMAQRSGLPVAIYPHNTFYVERTDHALSLAKAVGRKNLGLTFNLCHWLASTSLPERDQLKPHLKELAPYLKMITISGANNVITQQPNVWDDYILPLESGSFDTYELVRYCIKDLKLKVPVGVQCYNIRTNKYELVQHTAKVLKDYKQRFKK